MVNIKLDLEEIERKSRNLNFKSHKPQQRSQNLHRKSANKGGRHRAIGTQSAGDSKINDREAKDRPVQKQSEKIPRYSQQASHVKFSDYGKTYNKAGNKNLGRRQDATSGMIKGAVSKHDREFANKHWTKESFIDEIRSLGGNDSDIELVGMPSDSDTASGIDDFTNSSSNGSDTKSTVSYEELRNGAEKYLHEIQQLRKTAAEEVEFESDLSDKEDVEKNSVTKSKGGSPTNTDGLQLELDFGEVDRCEDSAERTSATSSHTAKIGKLNEVIARIENETMNIWGQGRMVIQPRPLWFEDLDDSNTDSKGQDKNDGLKLTTDSGFKDRVMKLIDEDSFMFHNKVRQQADRKLSADILKNGTLSDRIGTAVLCVQESPFHSKKYLEILLSLATRKSRTDAVKAAQSIKDLIAGNLLPNRKLRFLPESINQIRLEDLTAKQLMFLAFEDWLKTFYIRSLKVFDTLGRDILPFPRNHMVVYVYELLVAKPEQERTLLRMLVNKLGDKDRQIVSKASYQLLQLENVFPLMKPYIVDDLEDFLFRAGSSNIQLQLTIINTLNQTFFKSNEHSLATQILTIYFNLFRQLLSKSGDENPEHIDQMKKRPSFAKKKTKKAQRARQEELQKEKQMAQQSKLVTGILTGINRALPMVGKDIALFNEFIDTVYRLVHVGSCNNGILALLLAHKIARRAPDHLDRFYRALYEKLLDPEISLCTRRTMFLNLLHSVLREDTIEVRVLAFLKRIVQILSLHQAPMIIALLFIVSDILIQRPQLRKYLKLSSAELKENSLKSAKSVDCYDPLKREPKFCHAENDIFWELQVYTKFFHPTVALYANSIIEGKKVSPNADLSLHTLSHFFDRFVYRNAKEKPSLKGISFMQPLLPQIQEQGAILSRSIEAYKEEPVNSEAFLSKSIDEVPADEKFFYEYFSNSRKEMEKRQRKKHRDEEGEGRKAGKSGSNSDDEFSDEDLYDTLVRSRADVDDIDEFDEDGFSDDEDLKGFEEALSDGDEMVPEEDVESEGEKEPLHQQHASDADEISDGDSFYESDDAVAEIQADKADENDQGDVDAQEGEPGESTDSDDFLDGIGAITNDSQPVKKRKGKSSSSGAREKRQKLKDLPTFASAEDYQKLIDDQE